MVRGLSATAALTALLVTTGAALRYDADAGTVALDFYRSVQTERPAGARLAKRQGKTLGENISWGGLLYYINITLGTPGQPSAVWLDTGSSDLWLPDTGSDICQTSQAGCSSNGGFNPAHSSTYQTIARGEFQISYASGDNIMGDYGEDTLQLDDAKITDMIFGLAKQGQTSTPISGIMGIGYTLGESVAAQGTTYPNIVDKLVSSGIISSKTYSLYLNELSIGHGTILFGGVDTDKYTGELGIVDVQETQETQAFDTFTVVLSELSFTANGQANNINLNGGLDVILDSGTTLTYLPNDIATAIYDGLGVTYDANDGPFVPCNVVTDNMHFTFVFGSNSGVSIDIDLAQFVLPYDASDQLPNINGEDSCTFGIFPAGTVANGQGDILFGDTFLRSVYLVYDLDNNQIAMAPTKFNEGSSSNVEAIGGSGSASTNTIPGATTVQNQASVNQAANPTDIGAVPTGFGGAGPTAVQSNAVPTSVQATFNGVSGGLQTGSTVPASPGSTSKSAANSVRVPRFEWANVAVAGVAVAGALLGGGWFMW